MTIFALWLYKSSAQIAYSLRLYLAVAALGPISINQAFVILWYELSTQHATRKERKHVPRFWRIV